MEIIKTEIDDILILQPKVFRDQRGFFVESFREESFNALGLNIKFVQDNISKSQKNTIRGLHYQVGDSAQGKLCFVISGVVLDVAVDIRFGSPTFGKYVSVVLDSEKMNQVWIPPGFAHGFSVLSKEAIFAYKCTNYYNKENERALYFADEQIGIDWQVDNPIVSDKDKSALKLNEIGKDFQY